MIGSNNIPKACPDEYIVPRIAVYEKMAESEPVEEELDTDEKD